MYFAKPSDQDWMAANTLTAGDLFLKFIGLTIIRVNKD